MKLEEMSFMDGPLASIQSIGSRYHLGIFQQLSHQTLG